MKTFWSVCLGFALGVGAGIFASKEFFKKKYETLANIEIASVTETFEKYQTAVKEYDDTVSKLKTELSNVQAKMGEAPDAALNRVIRQKGKKTTQYDQIKQNLKIASIQPVEEEDLSENEPVYDSEEHLSQIPYIISDEEYLNGAVTHDKISLYYYKNSDILAEENDDIVEDIEETVGFEAISMLDKQSMVWVRNERLGADYEIAGVKQAYAGKEIKPVVLKKTTKKRVKNEE